MYAYHELIYDLIRLDVFQKQMHVFVPGCSVLGQNIFCIKAGCGKKKLLVVAGHHSLETILSEFLMEYLFRSRREWFRGVTLYAVPLLNPDGADIVLGRVRQPQFAHERARWQANYRGVDLNHNYDAGFLLAKEAVERQGIRSFHYSKYGGESPFSEPETCVIRTLCEEIPFDAAVALHAQGEEIYYEYDGMIPAGTDAYLQAIRRVSHYRVAAPTGTAAHGGMKDWFIQTYGKPAFTVEAGKGKNPLPHTLFSSIYRECSAILGAILNTMREG